jgi:flagellar motor switch protein FliG
MLKEDMETMDKVSAAPHEDAKKAWRDILEVMVRLEDFGLIVVNDNDGEEILV